jgi:hypothetical protein
MRKLLEGADVERVVIVHPYPDQIENLTALVKAGNPCIIPLRHSEAVRASWKKYGKDLNNFGGMSFGEWYTARDRIADAATRLFYLEIDNDEDPYPLAKMERDEQLASINRELGLELVTDWEPVRQADA